MQQRDCRLTTREALPPDLPDAAVSRPARTYVLTQRKSAQVLS